MIAAVKVAVAVLLVVLAMGFRALARDVDFGRTGTAGLTSAQATSALSSDQGAHARALLGGYNYVVKKSSPSPKPTKVVKVVKKSAPSPPPPAKKIIKKVVSAPQKKYSYSSWG